MEKEIENELERLGLEPVDRGRYWLIHCPNHDDHNKSAQCFKDGWIHCHAGCKRCHINSLAGREISPRMSEPQQVSARNVGDFTELWMGLEPISTEVKGVPASVLRKLGWKEYPGGGGYAPGILIPYFNTKRDKVIFFQLRHPEGYSRRFTFARGVHPMCYGLECLPKCTRFLLATEGSRDSVILRWAGCPAVALPSASSGAILKRMCDYCKKNNLILVWVGDNDEAGERLMSNINIPYIDARPSEGKDIGELFNIKGIEGVKKEYEKYRLDKDAN